MQIKRHPSDVKILIENILVAEIAACIILSSWAFGGRVPWSQTATACIAASTILPLFLGFIAMAEVRAKLLRTLPWLVFWLLLIIQIAFSLYNTHYDAFTMTLSRDLSSLDSLEWLSLTADSDITIKKLLLFGSFGIMGIAIYCCSLSHRKMRILLGTLAINAIILSLFGVIQKLAGAEAIYWYKKTASSTFFAGFSYHNHWSQFALLHFSILSAFLFRRIQYASLREFLSRSSILPFTCALTLLAGTIFLSTARAGCILVLTYFILVLSWLSIVLLRQKSSDRKPYKFAALILAAFLFVGLIAAWFYSLAPPHMRNDFSRLSKITNEALGAKYYNKDLRIYSYKHTFKMIQKRPALGWGLDNFHKAFPMFQGPPYINKNKLPVYFFRHAHSDWLQIVAEIGFIGLVLLMIPILAAAAPLFRGKVKMRVIPGCLLLGTVVMMLYAIIDFPLACPTVAASTVVLFCIGIRYQTE